MIFEAKSERFIVPDPTQGTLFDLPEGAKKIGETITKIL